MICRCEGLRRGDLDALQGAQSAREIRLVGRFGMGVCQGRFCAGHVARLAAQMEVTFDSSDLAGDVPRWPLRPVSLSALASSKAINPPDQLAMEASGNRRGERWDKSWVGSRSHARRATAPPTIRPMQMPSPCMAVAMMRPSRSGCRPMMGSASGVVARMPAKGAPRAVAPVPDARRVPHAESRQTVTTSVCRSSKPSSRLLPIRNWPVAKVGGPSRAPAGDGRPGRRGHAGGPPAGGRGPAHHDGRARARGCRHHRARGRDHPRRGLGGGAEAPRARAPTSARPARTSPSVSGWWGQDIGPALDELAQSVWEFGCDGLWVHARKAWLDGLSPKENRDVPPLDYGRVGLLKSENPSQFIGLNGGLGNLIHAIEEMN